MISDTTPPQCRDWWPSRGSNPVKANRVTISLVGPSLHPQFPSSSDNSPHDARWRTTKAQSTPTTMAPATAQPLHRKEAFLDNNNNNKSSKFPQLRRLHLLEFLLLPRQLVGSQDEDDAVVYSDHLRDSRPDRLRLRTNASILLGDRVQQAPGRAREASLPSSASNQSEVHVLLERANRE